MLRIPTVLLVTALAISPIASSTFHVAINEANAGATMKVPTLVIQFMSNLNPRRLHVQAEGPCAQFKAALEA